MGKDPSDIRAEIAETRARVGCASTKRWSRSSSTSSSRNACKTGRSIAKDGTRGSALES